ncbi:hypothetical protein SCUP234_10394 [Seiridium cupressi]
MATNYAHQVDGLDSFSDDLALANLDARGDGLGFFASGTDALNPSPPNFEPYRPSEYDFHSLNPYIDAGPVFSGCAVPNIGHYLPSFPDTFGPSSSLAPEPTAPVPTLDFIPLTSREFHSDHAHPFPTTSATPNIGHFSGVSTRFGAFDLNPPSMPVERGHSNTTGDASSTFSFSGGPSTSGCPFAPPRFHQQNNNQIYNHNPSQTPPQSNGFGANHNYNDGNGDLFNPSYPQLSIPTNLPPAVSGCTPEPNSDDYLAALLSGDFSSPSLPPHNSSPTRPERYAPQLHSATHGHLSTPPTNQNMPSTRDTVNRTAASTRPRRSSMASMVDLTSPKMERDGESLSGIDPTTPMAPPPSRKRRAAATGTPRASSRRPSVSTKTRPVKPLPSKRKASKQEDDDDDLFGDSSSVFGKDEGDDEVLDLTGTNEVPAELLKPKVDNRVKLNKFQCSICMDNISGLTVTHCGHMFCSECLHSALHIDHMKKTCPICRQKVDMKAKPGQRQARNTFYHLELKLMTSNRKGKRPMGQ